MHFKNVKGVDHFLLLILKPYEQIKDCKSMGHAYHSPKLLFIGIYFHRSSLL